jgi:hypothetical protein
MKVYPIVFLALFFDLLFLTSCSDVTTINTNENTKQLIPTKIGNYWVYQDSSYSNDSTKYDTVTGRITTSKIMTVNGEEVIVFTQCAYDKSGSPVQKIFIANKSDGLFSYGSDIDTNKLIYCGMIAKYPATAGYQWTCNYYYYQYNDSTVRNMISHATCVNLNDTYSTPMGTFNCISYKFNNEFGETTEYYAPGIGYLGFYNVFNGTFAGKRMLIDYKLY